MSPKRQSKKQATTSKEISFPCQTISQGKHKLFLFSATASVLWSILEINQRNPDKDEGYQRALSKSRVNSLARFYASGEAVPTALVVTFDSARVSPDGTKLRVPSRPDAGWVIDGQHRLAGAHEAESSFELPVVAFVGLTPSAQIRQFVTINREAKGVPTSLYYDLLKHLPQPKSSTDYAKERAADLASELKKDETSPFFGKVVVVTSPKRGEISLTNFVRKVSPLVHPEKGKLHTYTAEEQLKILSNFYAGLSHAFPEEFDRHDTVFFQTIGFGGAFNAFPTIFDLCIKHYHTFRVEDIASLLKNVDYFDFSLWRQLGTGNAAEMEAGNNLREELIGALTEPGEAPETIPL
jgi:DGQHR domain-containing protein